VANIVAQLDAPAAAEVVDGALRRGHAEGRLG
jgi:hypothetical protein